jgi:hypothetical protein
VSNRLFRGSTLTLSRDDDELIFSDSPASNASLRTRELTPRIEGSLAFGFFCLIDENASAAAAVDLSFLLLNNDVIAEYHDFFGTAGSVSGGGPLLTLDAALEVTSDPVCSSKLRALFNGDVALAALEEESSASDAKRIGSGLPLVLDAVIAVLEKEGFADAERLLGSGAPFSVTGWAPLAVLVLDVALAAAALEEGSTATADAKR